jgi:peptidyl-prolyl cis-trans isomerase D
MLAQLRTFSKSWIARAFILILVVGTAIWGVENALQSSSFGAVASVGGEKITPQQLSRELDLFLRSRNRDGQTLTQAQAVEAGVHTRLLESMISRRAIQQLAERLGVSASDQQVAEAIRNIPSVQGGISGGFSEESYDAFLREVGYSRPEFEREIRGDLSSAMLMQALTAGVRAPSSYGALVLAFETEQRTISLAEVPAAQVGAIPAPTQAQIETFYREHRAAFSVPEYRAITLVYARASDFTARVQIPEARLHEEFDRRRDSLTEPERRSFVQLSAPDEAKARAATQRLASGEDPDAVARALQLQVVRYTDSVRGDVADSTVAGNVFGLAANAAPTAVRGRLSPWAAVKLISVRPSTVPTFEAERERLRTEIATEEAGDLLNDAISAFDEARAGGTPIADAARANGLSVVQAPAVDAEGRAPNGQPAEAFVDQADLIHTAFQTAEGESSDFMPGADGTDVLIAVDHVTPETTRPLAEVREPLIAAWTTQQRARRLTEIAQTVVQEINGGKTFAQAVRDHHLVMQVSSRPIDRRTASQLPARGLAGAIFRARQGQAVADMRVDGNAAIIGVVENITRVSPTEAPQLAETARGQMQQTLGESLTTAIAAAAVARADVKRHEGVIRQHFGGGEEDQNPQTP